MELCIETCWTMYFCRKVKINLFVRPPTVLFLRFSEAQQGIFSLSRLTKEITITLSDRSLPVVMNWTVFHGPRVKCYQWLFPATIKTSNGPISWKTQPSRLLLSGLNLSKSKLYRGNCADKADKLLLHGKPFRNIVRFYKVLSALVKIDNKGGIQSKGSNDVLLASINQ